MYHAAEFPFQNLQLRIPSFHIKNSPKAGVNCFELRCSDNGQAGKTKSINQGFKLQGDYNSL